MFAEYDEITRRPASTFKEKKMKKSLLCNTTIAGAFALMPLAGTQPVLAQDGMSTAMTYACSCSGLVLCPGL